MLTLAKSKRFEAELRQAFRGGLSVEDWEHLEYLFLKGEPLPEEYDEHPLTDNWQGHWDCHLEGDLVVVYKRTTKKVTLVGIGTHQELLRHRKSRGFRRWLMGK
jgi:mRNA interferase YafQ